MSLLVCYSSKLTEYIIYFLNETVSVSFLFVCLQTSSIHAKKFYGITKIGHKFIPVKRQNKGIRVQENSM